MIAWAATSFAALALWGATPESPVEGQTRPGGLVSYAEAVRCAGLTQAASELEGGESPQGRSLYDAALYWSLAAMQAGQAAGRSASVAEADQVRARVAAVQQLTEDTAGARSSLARCRTLTPDLG